MGMQFCFFGSNERRRTRSRNRNRSKNRVRLSSSPLVEPAEIAEEVLEEDMKIDSTFEEVVAVPLTAAPPAAPPVELCSLISFSCQLAQGSPTLHLTNFTSVQQLFEQIANGFNISQEDIIFCTINTPTVNMRHLFTSSIEPEDMIFVHVKGQPVEIELTKTAEQLGVTIADNGLCRAFVKDIKEATSAGAARPALAVGQLIESIQGQSMLGKRHYEVAKAIRAIPIGQPFTIRLVNPLTSGFNFIHPRSGSKAGSQKLNNNARGMGTIRFKSTGGVVIQTSGGGPDRRMVEKLNELFDTYLGVQDDELAQTVWDTALECRTLWEMKQKVGNSALRVFNFPDELVFDMWGIVGDFKRNAKKTSPAAPS